MKRSEMVNYLSVGLKAAYGKTPQNRCIVAHELLQLLEKAGMKPPERWRDKDWRKTGLTYSEWIELSEKVNIWENEDETK